MPGCHANKFERKHDKTDIINKDFGSKMEHTKEKHQSKGVKHCWEHVKAIPDTDNVNV